MKHQILKQKIGVFVIMALLFAFNSTRAEAHGDLEFNEGNTTTREIAENTAEGTDIGEPLRYSIGTFDTCVRVWLQGPDAHAFEIVHVYRGAQLKTKSALDYETKNTYEVRVIASGSGLFNTDSITVTISVTDVNEVPFFSEEIDEVGNLIHRSIPENTTVGIDIGPPITAIDPDGSDVDLVYSLRGNDANMFAIDTKIGQLRTKMPLDYEAFESEPRRYFVEVKVSDGSESAKTEVCIDVEPVNEFAPTFIEGETTTREIHEKAEVGMNVGDPLTATDMDAGETLEYILCDTNGVMFDIDSSSGQLRIKAKLDYETKPVHTVKVFASDGCRVGSIIVTIQVLTDFVEIPDTSLATMVRLTLGLSTGDRITEEKILELTRLDAGPKSRLIGLREIEDLTGLESAPNLTTLLLGSNSVRDLTPLKGLTNLTTLEIYSNYVFSLAPLENLINLKSLHLGFNQLRNITPLKNLTNLTTLRLLGNSIRDLTPLKGLKDLTKLDLMGNIIEDVSPLSGLTNLRELHLKNNRRLRDASPLASLVNLEKLSLKGCPIEDTSPLADLTADIDIDVSNGSSPAVYGNIMDSLLDPAVVKKLNRKELQTLLKKLCAESNGSLKYQKEIAMLRRLLASMRPEKTLLLANYPNPFNPETWIPYHLAHASHVEISIYNMHGTVIKHLDLGYQQAGYHTNRKEAAYWDGTDNLGKRVASGPYFYQMHADNVSPIHKMLILK